MDVTVTLDQATAWKLADLIRTELSTPKRQSHLMLAVDDDMDMRDSLEAVANLLDR